MLGKKECSAGNMMTKSYPTDEILLAFRLGGVYWLAARDELQEHHTERVDISFLVHPTVQEVLGGKVPKHHTH